MEIPHWLHFAISPPVKWSCLDTATYFELITVEHSQLNNPTSSNWFNPESSQHYCICVNLQQQTSTSSPWTHAEHARLPKDRWSYTVPAYIYGVILASKIKCDMRNKLICKLICRLCWLSDLICNLICRLCWISNSTCKSGDLQIALHQLSTNRSRFANCLSDSDLQI